MYVRLAWIVLVLLTLAGVSLATEYRRGVHLASPTVRAGSVVRIDLSTETLGNPYAHMKADGSDLRFLGPDGTTALGHWIESWNPAGHSIVWVKVPRAGTRSLWMRYGDPRAISTSSGRAVFDFFDDFNDGIWRKNASNPILTRTKPWEERAVCEPSVLWEDGLFKMWYSNSLVSEPLLRPPR